MQNKYWASNKQDFENYIIDVLGLEIGSIDWENLSQSQKWECIDYSR